jgi:hypothetical protein
MTVQKLRSGSDAKEQISLIDRGKALGGGKQRRCDA